MTEFIEACRLHQALVWLQVSSMALSWDMSLVGKLKEIPLQPYITLIPTCKINHIHYKVWYEITYPFLNFNGATIEVPTLYWALLIHAGITVDPC